MTLFWKQVSQALIFGLLLPGILFSAARKESGDTAPPADDPEQIWIAVIGEDGRVRAMELESYVACVILGEMPASFHMEALKAQAVAARTYTIRMVLTGQQHSGAVCTDHTCCQAYRESSSYLASGGAEESVERVLSAVEQTRGQVLYHGDSPILATYFACAGGRTEDASAVWGTAYPYLRSVPSPEQTQYDDDVVRLTAEEFWDALGRMPEGAPGELIGAVTYTEGGGVASMWIGGQQYSGTELRSAFGLRSTLFKIEATEELVEFRTKGYGHRVGLSQYGAQVLAEQGRTCDQILSHYYQGTTLGDVEMIDKVGSFG